MINGKLTDKAVDMVRGIFGMASNYEVTALGASDTVVSMTLTNHLIEAKVKIPTSLVSDALDCEDRATLAKLDEETNFTEEKTEIVEETNKTVTPIEEPNKTDITEGAEKIHNKIKEKRVIKNAKKATKK